jgi:DNA recombination protein RmuC
MTVQAVTIILLMLVLLVLSFIAYRIMKDAPNNMELARLQATEKDQQRRIEELHKKASEVEALLSDKARLEADLRNERNATTEKLQLLQDSETRLKTEFENLANRIFEEKGQLLTDQNRQRIEGLLQPFKTQLESFRNRVDEVHTADTTQSASLLVEVKRLQELSNTVSDQANNLAKAITGDAKKQGDWGELIVERILEASGLEKGRDYEKQVGLRTEDGALQKPDFVIYLPGNKAVIIDSKVSLTAYDRFSNLDEIEDKVKALDEHLRSVRNHVNELQAKDYSHLLGNKTLDFVIMCVPLEPAYQVALKNDKELIYDLAKAPVVITGPTTLMITLKLIAQIWRRENENRNAEVIADRAGRMYDQVVLIVDALLDSQTKLKGVKESFDLALNRLKEGKGNLIKRVEDIRLLGAKVSKQLPPTLVEEAVSEDNSKNG